jgi:predicted nucleotidyltransferase component of viral defense system
MTPESKKERTLTNVGASVRARLLNIARQTGQDYNRVLIRFAQERLLFRFSISPYRDNFILKGALLFLSYKMPDLRPTKDIDFLCFGVMNDTGRIKSMLAEVASIKSDDGVSYYADTIAIEPIAEESEYGGLRVTMKCSVGGARNVLQIDLGFGDKIVDGPIDIDYPTLLDFPAPHIKVYSLESAIAEKFEAIVRFNIATSRMKDFYDLAYLARHHKVHADALAKALATTFTTRGTRIADRSVIFTDAFATDNNMESQWSAFHRTNKLPPTGSFKETITLIEQFLTPMLSDPTPYSHWQPDLLQWRLLPRKSS